MWAIWYYCDVRNRFLIFAVAASALISGCRRQPIVAKVGSLRITQSEFQRAIAEVAPSYQNYVLTPNGRRQFLDILIREKIILAAAGASDVPRSPDYRAQSAQLKQDADEQLRAGREDLLKRLWLDDLRGKGVIKVSDDDAHDYWRRHPVEVEMRHILVATPAEAEQLAKKVRSGASFAQLAKEHSLDAATAANGGKMPPAILGEIIPELEDIAFRMRDGEVGGPIKSKFGYHVLKKDGEKKVKFEDVEDRIKGVIEKQKLDKYLQSIQDKFPVEVVDEQFK